MRVVCSLTTIPSRLLDSKFLLVLNSINNQNRKFDQIYLTIPKISKKTKSKYPSIPYEINNLCKIVYCDYDYGPITKIVGGLLKENDNDTIIITCDDDIIYPDTLVEELINKHYLYPNSVIGSSGFILGNFPFYGSWVMNQSRHRNKWWFNFDIPSSGTKVDIICGYAGILYIRKFFPKNFSDISTELLSLSLKDNNLFFNDDIVLSLFLNKYNIEKRVFILSDVKNTLEMSDSISGYTIYSQFTFIIRFIKSILILSKLGYLKSKNSIYYYKSLTFPLFILILILILLLLKKYKLYF